MARFDLKECDLIMKGGVSSGIVYPYVIKEICKTYRLRSLGGTSAGAMAAVMAAAAEYRRQRTLAGDDPMAGFERIRELGDELSKDILGLFHPVRNMRRLFAVMRAVMGERGGAARRGLALGKALLWQYAAFWGPVLLVGLIWACCAASVAGGVLALIAAVVALALGFGYDLFVGVPKSRFGLCSGKTQPDAPAGSLALSDWLHQNLQEVAGRAPRDAPLCIGDLRQHNVNLATMTTDLSSGRPYELPMKERVFAFSRAEFLELFSEDFVEAISTRQPAKSLMQGAPEDLYYLPSGDAFPVLLMARMSLSFPGLIQTVPLYRVDNDLTPARFVLCQFSDGGISSNFPVHVFDELAPTRPTFGVSLSDCKEGACGARAQDRVRLGQDMAFRASTPKRRILSLGAFFMAMLNTAKDWRDDLQSALPGSRHRMVDIALDPQKEGGLNLMMSAEDLANMKAYGTYAGRALVENFDFERHIYERAVATYPKLHRALQGVSQAVGNPDVDYYGALLGSYPAYDTPKSWRKESLIPFVKGAAALGEMAFDHPTHPRCDARIRLVAEANRVPAHAQNDPDTGEAG